MSLFLFSIRFGRLPQLAFLSSLSLSKNLGKDKKKKKKTLEKMGYHLPVSKFPIIVSSPNLAFFQIELGGTTPSFSSPRKLHEWVVCCFLPWFKNTDTTLGCSALDKEDSSIITKETKQGEEQSSRSSGFSLAISAATSSSKMAANPLMCLVYE